MIHTEDNSGLISVVIPVYNQARELELALASIKKQTYKNIEIIIVDDGSETPPHPPLQGEGNKKRIPPPCRGREGGVIVLRQENKGAPVARNKGLAKAKGEYVIFWDADVVAVPRMLETMKATLDKNSKASFAYCDHKLQITNYKLQKKIKSQIFDIQKLRENNYIHSTSLIRRKDAIKWDESLKRFQDWDLWLTMAEQGKTGIYIPEILFTIISKGTISSWLPSFAYKKPWHWLPGVRGKVKKYEEARGVVARKHRLPECSGS